jgi:hypothetical protein
VELRQLGYFVAVAEERNFTRAAQPLLVAQPAVSRQVRLTMSDLRDEPFIALAPGTRQRTMIEEACRAAGFTPEMVLSMQTGGAA